MKYKKINSRDYVFQAIQEFDRLGEDLVRDN